MSEERRWKVDFNSELERFSDAHAAKVREAIELLERIVNGPHFLHALLAARGMNEAKGLSNRQIYDVILGGADLYGGADGDLDLQLAAKDLSAYGFVAASDDRSLRMYLDPESVDAGDLGAIAGAIMHEAMHKMGFEHKVRYRSFMTNTVPYQLGRLIHELAFQYYGNPTRPMNW